MRPLPILGALLLTACDPGWGRQSLVTTSSKEAFPKCAEAAVGSISGLRVLPEFSRANLVFVKTRRGEINITIEQLTDGNLKINGGAIGFKPTSEQLEYLTPTLNVLTTRVAKEC